MFRSQKFIFVLTLISAWSYSSAQKWFRGDYKFGLLGDVEAFYKFHENSKTWDEAKEQCELEGASLFYPENQEEEKYQETFFRSFSRIYIYIGIFRNDNEELQTVDGQPMPSFLSWKKEDRKYRRCGILDYDYYHNQVIEKVNSCRESLMFVCKKRLKDLQWNTACDMPVTVAGGSEFAYNQDLNRCYKVHMEPKSWEQAASICQAQLSYLAVPNSRLEAKHLANLVLNELTDKIGDLGVVCLGFKKIGEQWMTWDNRTSLYDTGHALWSYTQPDGGPWENCGAMEYSGSLHDIGCEKKCFFVCEHEI